MRYLVYGGERYYAQGGFHDLRYQAHCRNVAIDLAEEFVGKPFKDMGYEKWAHVVDTKDMKLIYKAGGKSYGSPD